MRPARELKEVFTAEQIRQRITELGQTITRDYEAIERPLIMIAMLKGSLYVLSDLSRAVNIPVSYDLLAISQKKGVTHTSSIVITRDIELDIKGRDVLIVEDIVRSGFTTQFMYQHLLQKQPNSLKVMTMLFCPERQLITLPLAYIGFEIDDIRLIGYGLDFRERGRNIPAICELNVSALLASMDHLDDPKPD